MTVVPDTDRIRKYANASDKEKRLSEAVADEVGIDPTYVDEHGVEWPVVQRVGQSGRHYTFWLNHFGAVGTVTQEKEKWSTAHADDGTLIEEDVGSVRDAAALAAEALEEAS